MPAFGVAATMETGDYHNPQFLNLEEYTVGEAPHSRTPAFPVDDRELQWVFCDGFNRGFDRQREAFPRSGRMLSYHARASLSSASVSGVQVTGSVTVS